MLYIIVRSILYLYLKVFYRFKVYGEEHLPLESGVIVVSNHANFIDPIIVGCSLQKRKVCFMAKEELFRIPVFGQIIRKLGAFPVKRGKGDRSAFRTAFQILKEQKVLGMFPEGTRYKDGKIHTIRQGATLLAAESGAKVLPMIIRGTNNLKLFRFPKIKVYIGEAFSIEQAESKKEMIVKGTAEIYSRLLYLWENA